LAATSVKKHTQLTKEMIAAEPQHADEIRKAVADTRQQYQELGFITSCGHWFSYINAAGVAFQPTDGSPLISITCGGIVDMIPTEACRTVAGPALLRLVERLHAKLGGTDDPGPLPDEFFKTGVLGCGSPLTRQDGTNRHQPSS